MLLDINRQSWEFVYSVTDQPEKLLFCNQKCILWFNVYFLTEIRTVMWKIVDFSWTWNMLRSIQIRNKGWNAWRSKLIIFRSFRICVGERFLDTLVTDLSKLFYSFLFLYEWLYCSHFLCMNICFCQNNKIFYRR